MSGPDVLSWFIFSGSFLTPFIVIVISGMLRLCVDVIVEVMASSFEKTLINCSLFVVGVNLAFVIP